MLANIFSTKFTLVCIDTENRKKFSQTWRNNMHDAEDAIVEEITSSEEKAGDYVKVTLNTDVEKFNMANLDDDAVGLLSRRAYDVRQRIIDVFMLLT